MKVILKVAAVFGVGLALSGCQAEMMSNDRMASSVADTLGVPASSVALSNRQTVSATDTEVTATLSNGKRYACTVNGGGLLAMGIINPPACTPAQ